MRNIIKKIFGIIFVFSVVFCAAYSIDTGKPVLSEEEVVNKKISATLDREEHRRIIKYEYEGKLNSNPFKYISVKNVISYINKITHEILAEFTVVMKFRYNEKTKEAQCLSTSYGSIAKDSDYSVNISTRKANTTLGSGSGIADVDFKYRGESQDKFSKQISCDYLGNSNVLDF